MTFEEIDKRIDLAKEWLKYYIESKYQYNQALDTIAPRGSPEYIMKMYEKLGFVFVGSFEHEPELMNFDQWLITVGYKYFA